MPTSRLALFVGALMGLTASQIPEYAEQYRQRRGGAIDELQNIVAEFDADAARRGLSEAEGIARLSRDSDEFVQERGRQMSEIAQRLQKLSGANAAIAQAGPLGRLVALASDFDPLIARRAYASYEPAVPVTSEGFILGGAGLISGFALFHALAAPFRMLGQRTFGRRRRKLASQDH
ncbi:MAG: DUF2937 family protein [Methylocella sp.]